jgi:hypothetical protein
VAETAGWLALQAVRAGRSVDRRLVESAALLHDVDKLPMVKTQVQDAAHADGSAEWLARQGYPELGPAIAGHPVTRLADATWFERWLATASPEALLVSYADKRAGQRLETMANRFASWERRYPPAERVTRARGQWTAEALAAVHRRAEIVERRACELAGVASADVRRLAWTGPALADARAAAGARAAVDAGRPAAGRPDNGATSIAAPPPLLPPPPTPTPRSR